jgi:thioredoxin reductase (NADPH)
MTDDTRTPLRSFVLLIEPDAAKLERRREQVAAAISSKFSIEPVASFAAAESFLTEIHEAGQKLEVVVASEDGDAEVREQFLGRVRAAYPNARLLLIAADPEAVTTCATKTVRDDARLAPLVRSFAAERRNTRGPDVEIIGDTWSPRAHQIKDFFCRHRVPYRWIDVEGDRRATRRVKVDELGEDALPLLVFSDGSELRNPSNDEVAEKLGFGTEALEDFYDLVIVGGGPAGLAAAVYSASEGLRTLVLERHAAGGQAGTSSLIENYLGFPEGLSGAELAQRAVTQATRFGAEMLLTKEAMRLDEDGNLRVLTLNDDSTIAGRAVVIATGVRYTQLQVPGADRLHGRGIYYGAASAEAGRYRGKEVCLLGGGNSAGQAAMLLARHAQLVRMIVFEPDIEARMSRYLAARIRATPNIELLPSTTIVEVHGDDRLTAIVLEDVKTKERQTLEATGLFVAIGAKPHTGWLEDAVRLDDDGFIVTGRDLTRRAGLEEWPLERWPMHLETSMPGVFAVGDARSGSVKRIGSAVGEGAMVVQFVHEYLRET